MKKKSDSHRPIIGILANIEVMEKEPFLGQERSSLHQNYVHAVIKAGGIPILLPVLGDKAIIQEQISLIDGLMLSGGYDVHPMLYGEEPHADVGYIYPDRDTFEIEALAIAYQQQKPILGICRGLQLMNVAFGGTLYQDISHFDTQAPIRHQQQAKVHVAWHSVDVVPATKLHHIMGQDIVKTNSFHHQSVKDLASGFVINAKAKDGIIEGIEKLDYPFLIGVQWHPERMIDHHLEMLRLFEAFIRESREARGR